jgi:flagellar protein FlgJ
MPLPWAPKSLVSDVDEWSFTNSANRAMTDLATMGERLMQPVTQQVRQVVEQAMPAPAPQPSPVPQTVVPSVPRFSLGKVEDWLTPAGPAAPAPELATPAPPVLPAPAPAEKPTGMFSLPSLESFLGRPSPTAAPAGQPSAAPSGAPGLSAEVRIDRSSPTAFLGSFRPAAEAALAAKGYPTSLAPILAAIPMNEQGWQKDAPGNNYYGIKGSNPRTGANTGPVGTWEDYGSGRTNIQDTFRAYGSPTESVGDFLGFLEGNPRYAQAVKIGRETGDPAAFIRAVHAAGYATDPAWSDKILSIARQVPERAATPPGATSPKPTPGPGWGTYTPETITPNQVQEGQAQGLSAEQALAICGPAAAVAFARANGRNPTLREAKELAEATGVWDVSVGMHGPASQVTLLEKMGVPATLEQGADWRRIAQEVQAGRPVIVDTPQHYFTVTAAHPDGTFEFGQSAGVLKASKGRTRYRPEEIPTLGMGAPRASIFMRR